MSDVQQTQEPLRLVKFNASLFDGKTIARVEAPHVNVTKFHFTDGSTVEMGVENMGVPGLHGMVIR